MAVYEGGGDVQATDPSLVPGTKEYIARMKREKMLREASGAVPNSGMFNDTDPSLVPGTAENVARMQEQKRQGIDDPEVVPSAKDNALYHDLDRSLIPGTPENMDRMQWGIDKQNETGHSMVPPGQYSGPSEPTVDSQGNLIPYSQGGAPNPPPGSVPDLSDPTVTSEQLDAWKNGDPNWRNAGVDSPRSTEGDSTDDSGTESSGDGPTDESGTKPKPQPQGQGYKPPTGFPPSIPGAPGFPPGAGTIPGAPTGGFGQSGPSDLYGNTPGGTIPGAPNGGLPGMPGEAAGGGRPGIPGAPQSGQTGMSSTPGYGGGPSMGGIPGAPASGGQGSATPDQGGQPQNTPKGPYVPPKGGGNYFPPNIGLGADPYGMNNTQGTGVGGIGGAIGGFSGGGNQYGSNVPTQNNMISQQEKDAAKQFLQGTFDQFQAAQDAANKANTDRYDQQLGILSGLNTNNNNNLGDLSNMYGQRTQQYGQGMNNVVGAMNDRFSNWASNSANVGRGYDNLNADIQGRTNLLGQTQAANIDADYAQQMGQAEQDLISRGLGNTTIRPTVQRGINYDNQRAKTALAESVNNTLNQNDMSTRLPMLSYGERATNFGAGLQGDTAQTMQQGIQGIAGLQGEGLQFGERANAAQTNLGGKIVDTIGARNDTGPDYNTMAGLAGQIAGAGYGFGSVPSMPAAGTGQVGQVSSPNLPYYSQPSSQPQQNTRPKPKAQPWATIY